MANELMYEYKVSMEEAFDYGIFTNAVNFNDSIIGIAMDELRINNVALWQRIAKGSFNTARDIDVELHIEQAEPGTDPTDYFIRIEFWRSDEPKGTEIETYALGSMFYGETE